MADVELTQISWKRYAPWLVLCFILIFGGYLRFYHIDYPVVGYHNWKETHYLTEARNFAREGFFAHGFFVPAWDLPFVTEDLSGAHADTFPTISILGGLVYRYISEDLGALRSIGVLLNLASIVLFYFIVKHLFKREDIALTSAALFAMNPLMVFFSRNFQLDSPALFFMLLGAWFLFRWIEKDTPRDFIFAVAFTVFGIVTKYSFVVMAFPYFAIFPYKRLLEWKARIWAFIPAAGICALSLMWFVYMEYYFKNKIKALYNTGGGGAVISLTEIVKFKEVLTASFWQTMKAFVADNFTLLGFGIALAGLGLLYFMRKRQPFGSRYFLAYAGFGIFFTVILAYKLSGHSYHQFPYAPLIVFLIAYAFVVVANTIASISRIPQVKWVVLVLLIAMLWPQTNAALDRQFGTQFPGLNAAGDYVKENSESWERIMHSSHQSYGVLWHADRKGYKVPSTVADIQKEEAANATWIFIYQWRFDLLQNEEVMDYVGKNYALRQVGFVMPQGQFQPYYLLLQKGGTFNISEFPQMLTGKQLSTRQYELPGGIFEMNVVTLNS